jgi:hypothetical protein
MYNYYTSDYMETYVSLTNRIYKGLKKEIDYLKLM